MKYLICDIDGTLADMTRRLVHMPDWDMVHQEIEDDPCYPNVVELIKVLGQNYPIIFLTGRPERYRVPTMRWLVKHDLSCSKLLMRPNNNFMKDPDMKWSEAVSFFGNEEKIKEKVFMVIDDIDRCVQMWRDKGLFCIQPRIGDY